MGAFAATAADTKDGYDRIEDETIYVDNTIRTKASNDCVLYNLPYKTITKYCTLLMVFVIAVSYARYDYSAGAIGSNDHYSLDMGLPAAASAAYLNGDNTNSGSGMVLYTVQDVVKDANQGSYQIVDQSMKSRVLYPAKVVGASTGSDAFPLDEHDVRKNAKSGNFKTFFNDPKYEFHRTLAYMNDQISGHRDQTTELKNRGYSVFTLDGVASVGTVNGSIVLFKKDPTSNEGGIVVIVCEGTRSPKRNNAAIVASDLEDITNIYLAMMTKEPHRYKVTEDVAKKVYDEYGGEGSAYRIFATGHSLGGAAAANLGATRPDLVEAAIVFDPESEKLNSNELEKSLARANSHPDWAAKTLREKIMVSRGGSTAGGGVIVHRYVEDRVSKYNTWGLQFSWKFNKNQKMPKDGIIPAITMIQAGNWPVHKPCHFIKSPNAENC